MAAEVAWNGVSECPPLETIAAFVDGRLSGVERDRIAAHVASCETCYFVFTESAQTEPFVSRTDTPSAAPRWWQRPVAKWSAAAAGLAAAAALAIAVTGTLSREEVPQLTALVAAVGTDRTIEPRLTGGFAYGPVRGPVRAGEPAAESVPPDVRIAAAQIEKEALVRRTPQTLQALGIAYLVMGDAVRAVPILEEAADQGTPDPRVLSDLSAAYLVRATRENTPQDLAKALASADRAVKADPAATEAWFNRAYALERLSLSDQAAAAWEQYLRIDATSGWATEARTRLATLRGRPQSRNLVEEIRQFQSAADRGDDQAVARLVDQSPDAARVWLEELLLVGWPREVLAGGVRQAALLSRAERVAAALATEVGDRFALDVVAAARRRGQDARAMQALARGHQQFEAASEHYRNDRIAEAMSGFEPILAPLERAGSPLAIWTRLYLAIGRYYGSAIDEAFAAAAAVAAEAKQRNFVRLHGLASRFEGLTRVVGGDFPAGLEAYRRAAAAFDQVRDLDAAVAIKSPIAEDLAFLGEADRAWTELAAGLSQLPSVRDYRSRHNILQRASLASMGDGLPEAAAYFQDAVLENAKLWQRPLAAFDAHLYKSEIFRQVGALDEARAALRHAQDTLTTVDDQQLVARNAPRLLLAEGEIEADDGSHAVDVLTRALETFERSQRHWPIARVLLARGRAHAAAGRVDLAEADYGAGIELFERRRASITDEALRTASFEQPWDLYSEMIALQVSRRRQPEAALAFAERARARTLLEALEPRTTVPSVSPSTIRTELPPAVSVVYFVTLQDRLLTWVLSRDQYAFVESAVRQSDFIHLLNQFRSELAAQPTTARDTISLARLYDALIRPVRGNLLPGSRLVIIPDGPLHHVPFAALLRREDRRYLLEDHALQVAPSLSVYLATTRDATALTSRSSAFVVGNPKIEGESAAMLRDLPEAAAEAQEIAQVYESSVLLVGAEATKDAFLAGAPEHHIVHFAGHALANEQHPQLSRLLLAGEDDSARSLFSREIAGRPFRNTRLVVLGACRTSSGRVRRGEGVFSLARPFLAAGVPAVVAALWDVNDRASRQLLVAFHRSMQRSPNAADALRRAQVELMGDTNPLFQSPSAWAGFVLIGGEVLGMTKTGHLN